MTGCHWQRRRSGGLGDCEKTQSVENVRVIVTTSGWAEGRSQPACQSQVASLRAPAPHQNGGSRQDARSVQQGWTQEESSWRMHGGPPLVPPIWRAPMLPSRSYAVLGRPPSWPRTSWARIRPPSSTLAGWRMPRRGRSLSTEKLSGTKKLPGTRQAERSPRRERASISSFRNLPEGRGEGGAVFGGKVFGKTR